MKSKKFNIVKYYYDNGLWNKEMVKLAIDKNWITEEEYNEIVK